MPEDRTVLDHLHEGRDALQREVARLTAAIEQLDSVLGRIGSTVARSDAPPASASAGDEAPENPVVAEPAAPVAPAPTYRSAPEPVNPPAEVEAPPAPTVPSRPRVARKAPAEKVTRARRPGATSEPPKSIRVHVLEMLEAENREFGLAEIIDRVHDAGIQAHDDAVRSITIKLMKDGSVERVGRGQYRLARRGTARASAAAASTPRVTEPAPEPPVGGEPVEPAAAPEPEATTYPTYAAPADVGETAQTATNDAQSADAQSADTQSADTQSADTQSAEIPSAEITEPGPADPGFATEPAADQGAQQAVDEQNGRGSYAPSLNLGQPWKS